MTSVFKRSVLSLLFLLSFIASSEGETSLAENRESLVSAETGIETPKLVFVIPINEAINQANLFVLRRGLKEAIRKNVDMVILDMDTPGGSLDICLEMMEMESLRTSLNLLGFKFAPALRKYLWLSR